MTEIQSKKLPKSTRDSNLVPFVFVGDNIALTLAAAFIKKQNCNLSKLDYVSVFEIQPILRIDCKLAIQRIESKY